jgi:hypothetical protein
MKTIADFSDIPSLLLSLFFTGNVAVLFSSLNNRNVVALILDILPNKAKEQQIGIRIFLCNSIITDSGFGRGIHFALAGACAKT